MNVGVAARAGLIRRRPRAHAVNRALRDRAVALVAQSVDRRHVEHACVLRSVRAVTTETSLRLDRRVLEHEGSARFRVALGADRVLIGRGFQVRAVERPVRIVAVIAAHHAFVHRVMERHVEARFLIGVALEAQLRLRRLQQRDFSLRRVDAVAAGAANVGLRVRGAIEVRVRAGVAAQARLVNLLRAELVKAANLRHIAAAFHVGLPGSVTAFAGHSLTGMFKSKTRMRIRAELLHDLLMTCGAGLLTDELGRIGCRLWFGSCRLLGALARSLRQPGSCEPGQQKKARHAGKEATHAYSPRTARGQSHFPSPWLAEITAIRTGGE